MVQNNDKWYNGGEKFDNEITENFLKLYESAIAGELDSWMDDPKSCLALIILLDQFPRNMFRGNYRSFEYDFKALYATKIGLKKWYLDMLEGMQKHFFLMPLMHAESLVDQDLSVEMFQKISSDGSENRYAIEHRDIIAKYGRFPHRNKAIWRVSTQEEIEFMKQHSGF